ncbi:hypothetical protein IMZ48_26370 [Candidatus Bathyarchaeota archaeon]|nr:hypothetical protein [Candidatus Bathyarchaeota archaeon]
MPRRQHLVLVVVAALASALTIFYLLSGYDYVREGARPGAPKQDARPYEHSNNLGSFKGEPIGAAEIEGVAAGILNGGSIAPKLENATAK